MVSINRIIELYTKPGHPISFTSPGLVFKYFKGRVPLKKIKAALGQVDGYTLHREEKRPSVFNPYFIYNRREQVQADLIEVIKLSEYNDGIRYLLSIIDVFSRRVWIFPLKRKTADPLF